MKKMVGTALISIGLLNFVIYITAVYDEIKAMECMREGKRRGIIRIFIIIFMLLTAPFWSEEGDSLNFVAFVFMPIIFGLMLLWGDL